jgi:hypothetical protein
MFPSRTLGIALGGTHEVSGILCFAQNDRGLVIDTEVPFPAHYGSAQGNAGHTLVKSLPITEEKEIP